MEEWKEYKLGELTTMKNGKKRPKNVGLYPVYGGNGVMDYADNYNAENVIIVGRVGAYCGNVFKCDNKCWVSDNAISVFANDTINKDYLYYLMCTLDLHHHHIGAAQPLMTQDIIGNFEVKVPTFSTQQKIANILSSLDDKIEVNRRINEQLEELAQALFKSWFVDFEPFKDGEFVESELGMIPEGWKVDYIANVPHTIETGKRPKGGVGNIRDGIPSIGAENIKGLGYYDYSKTKFITEDFANKMKKGEIKGYELLIYKDGGKPGYFIPNFSIFGEGFPFEKMYLNEHVFKLDFYDKGFNIFAYFYFQTEPIMSYLNAQGGKAAIPGINQKDVENIQIFTMDNEYVKLFCENVSPLIEKILINSKENRYLTNLRDTLLPKLMSGDIDVNDVEI